VLRLSTESAEHVSDMSGTFKDVTRLPKHIFQSTVTDVIVVLISSYSSGAKIFQKSTRHPKIIDAKTVT
jgi:hypothetical protein